jgi:hypothetical protein
MTGPCVTIPVTMMCPVCGSDFTVSGRRRYCSDACKQHAWRDRHAVPPTPPRLAPADTLYICPECDTRYLGERRCPDCNLFTKRLGPGGPCPHCEEPVALIDIIPDHQPANRARTR